MKRAIGLLMATFITVAALLYAQGEHIVLGAQAYLYGYPLVMMDLTRVHAAQTVGPENHLRRVRQFPGPMFRNVVRPNVDTLYTTAFIDMAQGPWVFRMAPNATRYEVMAFLDAWTDVFAAPGTRTHGAQGGTYLLAGPGWHGTVPSNMKLLQASTQMVWLIGRTQTNGAADFPIVHALQDGLQLQTLSQWQRHEVPAPAPVPLKSDLPSPIAQMRAMPTDVFFSRLAHLLKDNPPKPADGPMLAKLDRLGIAAGQSPNWGWLDRRALGLGRWLADFQVARELQKPRALVHGWSTPPSMVGDFGMHYNIRAVVAMVGLGANLPQDAMYPQTRVDDQGQRLHGKHRYRLHFQAGALPPVQAFWSITAYNDEGFLLENPLQRFALGDRDPLVFNADGSLDLWVQADDPRGSKSANWLPVQAASHFLLNARLYWAKPEALDGRWHMPAVQRLD